jgi:hypothetical protein
VDLRAAPLVRARRDLALDRDAPLAVGVGLLDERLLELREALSQGHGPQGT